MKFIDRTDAGVQLANKLSLYKKDPNVLVVGLPRGGVVTAFEVARALDAPLDIVVPRKIGAPFNPELAVGAITSEGDVVWNQPLMEHSHLKPEDLQESIQTQQAEAQRRLHLYRAGRAPLNLTGKTVLLIDDGIATGATMRAAIAEVKKKGAEKIIVGVPVGTLDALTLLEPEVDEIVCVHIPKTLFGIGAFYEQFAQTEDAQVIDLMQQAQADGR